MRNGSDLRKLLRALEDQGFDWELTRTGRIRVSKDDEFVVVLSRAGSDWRGIRNAIATLRRAGFAWPPKR